MGNLDASFGFPTECDSDCVSLCKLKIFEPCHGSIPQIGDILISVFHAVFSRLGEERVDSFVEFPVISGYTMFTPEIAGDAGFVLSATHERGAVETAAGDFRLTKHPGGQMLQLFCASLTAVGMLIGLTVVKDIPVIADVQHPTVGIPQIVGCSVFLLVSVQEQISLVNQSAAKPESPIRVIAYWVAQFVIMILI